MALFNGKLLDAYFIRPFYKMMLDLPITLEDIEAVDIEYYNSLRWLLDNDPEPLCLTFQVDHDEYGEMVHTDLKPGGADIDVTKANRQEYVDLVIKHRFVNRIQEQMTAFMRGLTMIIPQEDLSVFDPSELELLIGGISAIDVNDWRTHTKFLDGYTTSSPPVKWFWEAVHSFTKEQRARLLQFVTGTSRVPIGGFAELYGSNGAQKFCIARRGVPPELPRSHTCFNRIDLPPYESYAILRKKLLLAVENTQGYDGVD
ncbi:uncharacterized protein MONBRDRAFT_29604 [Monosiga brevicollis MX1]|uniref:HECT-type E3 ubiquitin transferase n=1 Tax=Monosiga brevicollis TaxID=81824 RepID=A9VBK7_MONBE|nr:uncharacterized protein MONBRDRAFT_29604 [Monosiga brevicollis MX1]EDQ85081.1 predicted protein [Monosiga brevicollis MX1]|eukprot:XP_001750085.1 hypothetical protein [Monosiga brevicollis MX1]